MDSSPLNHYLLLDGAVSFRPAEKVAYALEHPLSHGECGARWVSRSGERSSHLLRSLEELRRVMASSEKYPVSPSTGTTFNGAFAVSTQSSPERISAPVFFEKTLGATVDDVEDTGNSQWDNFLLGTSVWKWPVEVLYQRYHLLVAIDFSLLTFDVSENGMVLIDRVSCAIDAMLHVVEETLRTREREAAGIERWVTAHLDVTERAHVMRQVWHPAVDVSVVLINVPRLEMVTFAAASPLSNSQLPAEMGHNYNMKNSTDIHREINSNTDDLRRREKDGDDRTQLFPADAQPFYSFSCGAVNDNTSTNPSVVSLLTMCDAAELLRGGTFLRRLEETLRGYEETCRSRRLDEWPDRTLYASIEHLVRLIPERPQDCTSLLLIGNADRWGPSDNAVLLESEVRRKNIILSILSLSDTPPHSGPQSSPLSQFLLNVGGFAVHFDYWLAMASPRLNVDWCHRFEGPRCLAQQLFVQLESQFPVVVARASQHLALSSIDRQSDGCVLYNAENGLPDFALCDPGDVKRTLRCVAEARLNEGWSVIMDYDAASPNVAHLYARCTHHLRRGRLTLAYEMDINYPIVYRRVVAFGTRALVDHFTRARLEERVDAKTSWTAYLALLRAQLHGCMRAEQTALQCLLLPATRIGFLEELQWLSNRDGVSAAWSAHCSQRSIGLFFSDAAVGQRFLGLHGRQGLIPVSLRALRVLRGALRKEYTPVGNDESDTFLIRFPQQQSTMRSKKRNTMTRSDSSCVSDDGSDTKKWVETSKLGLNEDEEEIKWPCGVLQIFALNESASEGSLAAAFECRFSFFIASAESERRVINLLVHLLTTTVESFVDFGPLRLTVGCDVINARALHLTTCTLAPRRLELSFPPMTRRLRQPSLSAATMAQRGVITPFSTSPWLMADAVVFRWVLSTSETCRTLGEAAFDCVVARRLQCGFQLLHCSGGRRALLHASRQGGEVDIFDLIDTQRINSAAEVGAALGTNSTNGGVININNNGGNINSSLNNGNSGTFSMDLAPLTITRYARPFSAVSTINRRRALTMDIADDIHVATVLYTFAVLSAPERYVPPSSASLSLSQVSIAAARRGTVQLIPSLESLLPFLPAERAHTVTLHPMPALGVHGVGSLRTAVCRLTAALGESSATVRATAVPSALRERIAHSVGSPIDTQDLFVALLRPVRSSCLTLLLVPLAEHANDTSVVAVTAVALDASVLHAGLMRRYGYDTDSVEVADSTDGALLDAIGRLLTAFAGLYQAWSLLERQRHTVTDEEEEDVSETDKADVDAIARDVRRVFTDFQDYQTEVDITHLLYVQQSHMFASNSTDHANHSATGNSESDSRALYDALCAPVAMMVRTMSLRPLPAHPGIFIPFVDGVSDGDSAWMADSVGGTPSSRSLRSITAVTDDTPSATLTTLPFLVRIGLFLIAPDGKEEEGILVMDTPSPCEMKANTSNATCFPNKNDDNNVCSTPCSTRTGQLTHRLVMRLFVKTASRCFLNLSRNSFNPPVEDVRRVLSDLLRSGLTSTNCEDHVKSHFFDTDYCPAELSSLHTQSLSFDALPPTVRRRFEAFAADLARGVANYCLTSSINSAPFNALRDVIVAKPNREDEGTLCNGVRENANASLASIATTTTNSGGNKNATPIATLTSPVAVVVVDEELDEENTIRVLAQSNRGILDAVGQVIGLRDILTHAVAPALLSDAAFETDSFAVEFTQQSTYSATVDPTQALLHVFKRCLAEDFVCVVPVTDSGFLYVPNSEHFDTCWILVQLTADKMADAQRVSLRVFDKLGDLRVCWFLCRHLRRLITDKATEVSQLHLLKQLRDTQNANKELIPMHWGDQFTAPGLRHIAGSTGTANSRKEVLSASSSTSPAAFYCRGVNVLEIPIYYKLQHQCKKILSRIASNSSRLELITIYNREQCFVVADDVQRDTFHYVRLVFIKDTAHPPSVTASSPPLSPADRCPILAAHLFSATRSVSIQRPLRKLRDFCFFLAIQELQGHLNYVQHKIISAVDLIFLQYRRLDPVTVDLKDVVERGEVLLSEDVQLAFALVVLGLKENKFKYFEVQDSGGQHTLSNFVEYYKLLGGEELDTRVKEKVDEKKEEQKCNNKADKRDEEEDKKEKTSFLETVLDQAPNHLVDTTDVLNRTANTMSSLPTGELRFVKIIEAVTDVLVSCSLRVVDESRLIVDRFLTKLPEERYTTGESETTNLKQIDDIVRDTVWQWRFFALSKHFTTLPLQSVVPTVEQLMQYGASVTSAESSTLRFKHFSLDHVSQTVFPFLIARLAGVLEPISPICLECRAEGTLPSHITGFPWRWMEHLQSNPHADLLHIYITCGYHITTMDEESGCVAPASVTRALRVWHPDLLVTNATVLKHSPLLREHGIVVQLATEPRAVVHITLREGVTAALFNLRDSDILLRLMGHVIAEAEQQSSLLYDVMLQRMGLSVPSCFTETALARMCCGDDSNVMSGKRLSIYDEMYRRRVNHVRFPIKSSASDDPFTIVVEGLFNRGLMVNASFCLNDAIQVLYDESPQYTLKECRRILQGLVQEGVFAEDTSCKMRPRFPLLLSKGHQPSGNDSMGERQSMNCRVVNSGSIPDDALIACSYQRHIQASHIVVESHHARSGITESLYQCETIWSVNSRDNFVRLAKAAILLQQRSKQIFGSRVPDFSLRRERWSPGDDILDPALPPRNQQSSEYGPAVDAALQSYANYLRRIFPSSCIIDLDPSDPIISSDNILLHRLRCRYGKVVLSEGKVVLFTPHLYYVLVPVADSIRLMGYRGTEAEQLSSLSITEGGLLIIELGFQVVHFALDVFMMKGESVPAGVAAQAAAWFKQSLTFSSVLYDLTVSRLLHCVQMYATQLSCELQTSAALEGLIKYYPNPPSNSLNIAVAFDVDDPSVRRMWKLMMKRHHRHELQDDFHCYPKVEPNEQPPYPRMQDDVDGDMVQQLVPEMGEVLFRDVTRERYHYCGLMVWKSWRLFVLLSTTRDVTTCERPMGGELHRLALRARRLLLQLLLDNTLHIRLECAWERFRTVMGGNGGDEETPCMEDLQTVQRHSTRLSLTAQLEQLVVLRVHWAVLLKARQQTLQTACHPHYALHFIVTSDSSLTMTLAACKSSRERFVAVEFARDVIRSATLYRGANEHSTVEPTEEEIELIEHTLKLLTSMLWSSVMTPVPAVQQPQQ